jgi:hypothetical protein
MATTPSSALPRASASGKLAGVRLTYFGVGATPVRCARRKTR